MLPEAVQGERDAQRSAFLSLQSLSTPPRASTACDTAVTDVEAARPAPAETRCLPLARKRRAGWATRSERPAPSVAGCAPRQARLPMPGTGPTQQCPRRARAAGPAGSRQALQQRRAPPASARRAVAHGGTTCSTPSRARRCRPGGAPELTREQHALLQRPWGRPLLTARSAASHSAGARPQAERAWASRQLLGARSVGGAVRSPCVLCCAAAWRGGRNAACLCAGAQLLEGAGAAAHAKPSASLWTMSQQELQARRGPVPPDTQRRSPQTWGARRSAERRRSHGRAPVATAGVPPTPNCGAARARRRRRTSCSVSSSQT